MRELSIGEVAREAGMPASTLRYYEKAGLLPAPPRRSGQRCYSEAVFGRINLIRLALEAGFTIGETRVFLSGFSERSEEHTSELQSLRHLVCRLLLEKKTKNQQT